MELKEFQDLLDRYGGDPTAWPADRRPEARALAQTSPEAFRLLRETSEVERALTDGEAPEPDFQAIDRVMERIRVHEESAAVQENRSAFPPPVSMLAEVKEVLTGFIYRPLLLITMASLIGVIVGFADRTTSVQESYSGLIHFMMTL